MSSSGAVLTANPSRDLQGKVQPGLQDYRKILPILPTGTVTRNCVFLHADPSGRPYGIPDFAKGLEGKVERGEIKSLGAYLFNHLWIVAFNSALAKQKCVELKEILVKGRKCLIIDPNQKEIMIKLHWLPAFLPDDEVRNALEHYGTVQEITREKWRYPGFEEIETTTRIAELTLKTGVTVDHLPHQMQIAGTRVLVSVPGRPPMCLKCKRIGHMRKDCHTPWCRTCRTYGHDEHDCVRTYASMTRADQQDRNPENLLERDGIELSIEGAENKDDSAEPEKEESANREDETKDSEVTEHGNEIEMWEVAVNKRKGASQNLPLSARTKEGNRKEQRREVVYNKRMKQIQQASLVLVPADKSSLEDPDFVMGET